MLLFGASSLLYLTYASSSGTVHRPLLQVQWPLEAAGPWLSRLQTRAVRTELAALVAGDKGDGGNGDLFQPNWDPSSLSMNGTSAWESVPLLNKGRLQRDGCRAAASTCATLAALEHHLRPRPGRWGLPAATEVGVRVLKLRPGAQLRPHHGPGGRLVAHLGLKIPAQGSSLTLAGEKLHWTEGEWLIFDDSVLHSAENLGNEPRYILHVTFPNPNLVPPASSTVVLPSLPDTMTTQLLSKAASRLIASTNTSHLRLDFFSNCQVQVTNLRNLSLRSPPEPLLTLYNKVADNREDDWDTCIAAAKLADGALRITAPHQYGTLDINYKAFDLWVTFELADLDMWRADMTQRHLKFAMLCPADICSVPGVYDVPGVGGKKVNGLFQGFRGAEGQYADSTGFLTISSDWQRANEMYFAKRTWKVAYTLVPTKLLPKVWAGVRANHPEIPKPNKNRARTWYWAGGGTNSSTLDETIALAKSMGIELIFFGSFMNNIGDYTSDPVRWPAGLGVIRDRIHAAGLQIGLHILSPGSTVCLDQMTGCRGNIHIDTDVSRRHPEYFVPQGPAPRDWYWANSAGTWYCHEQTGKHCHDTSKTDYLVAGPGHPYVAPPDNPILLVGNVSWSKLGRYREGGAILFDGKSYGQLVHTSEYNFTYNQFYPRALSEFTLQLTIHPVGPTVGRVQVLVDKPNEWQLRINERGQVEWHVHLVGDGPGRVSGAGSNNTWTYATGTRVLRPGFAYVIKATHAGGTLKVFTCLLADDYSCELGPTPEGQTTGACSYCKEFWSNGTAMATGTGDPSKVKCLYGNGASGGNIIWGAEQDAAATGVDRGFVGAMEEMFLSKLSLENITAHLYSCPGCGCNNFYIWNYQKQEVRDFWANGTARLFNEAGAEASQWDGTDMLDGWGWGLPHSKNTWSAGYGRYWQMSADSAYVQSQSKWKQELAVEDSGGLGGGLGKWHGDMMPFADEQLIKGGICVGGDVWHRGLLLDIVSTGKLYNAYNTPVETLHGLDEVDCFLGGLVATGIPPQMAGGTTSAAKLLIPRIKYWLDLYRRFGMATESSVDVLHYPDIFLVGLSGGTEPGDHRGLFAGSTAAVVLPDDLADNATLLTFLGFQIPSTNISFGSQVMKSFTLFAASDNATIHMGGHFWDLEAGESVTEIVMLAGGGHRKAVILPVGSPGAHTHAISLRTGDYARYEKN